MRDTKLARLSNDDLLKDLLRACMASNEVNVRIIRLLIEVEERRLHLHDACSSMFDFCTRRLGMSEGAAYLRIAAARLVCRFPILAERIERGELHLSTLVQLRDFLTEENVQELLESVRGKSKRQVMELLAGRAQRLPLPVGPAKLRKLPKMRTANEIAAVRERELEVIAEMQYRLGLTLDRAERDEVLHVRDLMMHRNPSGDLKAVFMTGVRTLREELEREIFATNARPKTPAKAARKTSDGNGSKTHDDSPSLAKTLGKIPPAIRREVFERDGYRCTFTNKRGDRCPATSFLQPDHIVPPLLGGTHDPTNLRVRCQAHNLLHAEAVYGKEFVARKIRSSQLKSRERALAKTRGSRKGGKAPGVQTSLS